MSNTTNTSLLNQFATEITQLNQMYEQAEDNANLMVGISMILASSFCLLINIVVIKAMWVQELLSNNSYKFMIALGFADTVQCLAHFITGFFTIYQNTGAAWFAKALGVFATPAYVFYAIVTIILSLNRFTVVVDSQKLEHLLFSPTGVKCWFVLALAICGGFMLALASPWASIVYLPDEWSWTYDYAVGGSAYVQSVEKVIEIGGIPIAGLIYLHIFIFVLKKRKAMHLMQKNIANDMKILIQAVTIMAYCTVLNVFWHYSQVLLPATKVAYMSLNFMWIFNAAVNPVIYFVVNAAIRHSISAKIGIEQLLEDKIDTPPLAKHPIIKLNHSPKGTNNNHGQVNKVGKPGAPLVNNFVF